MRRQQRTLIDPFELPGAFRNESISIDLEVDFNEPAAAASSPVVPEESPRGVRYEAWCRARAWGDDKA